MIVLSPPYSSEAVFSQKIAPKSHQNRTWFFRMLLIDRRLTQKSKKLIFPKKGTRKTHFSPKKEQKHPQGAPSRQNRGFFALKIAQNRKKSHLVFVDVVDTQAIKRKIEKPHFPKIETKTLGHHHGEPEGKKQ